MLKKGYSGAGVYSKKNQTQYTSGLAAQNSTLKAAMYVAILTTFRSFLSIALPDRHHRKDRKQNSALWMNFFHIWQC
jgi:hypothetical protein